MFDHSTPFTTAYKSLAFLGMTMYVVAENGDVWSYRNKCGWKKLKQNKNRQGYLSVKLYKTGGKEKKCYRVNRLVLLAFVGPCPEGMEGCHNDGNNQNNHRSNLRWDTPKNNARDRGRMALAKLTDYEVTTIRRLYSTGKHSMQKLADVFEVDATTIHAVVHGKQYKDVPGVILQDGKDLRAKLTEDDVREMRRLHTSGECNSRVLSKKYGVTKEMVNNVVSRRSWKHVV